MNVSTFVIHYENTDSRRLTAVRLLVFDATSLEDLHLEIFLHFSREVLTIFRSLQRFSVRFKSRLGHSKTLTEATSALPWLCVLSHSHVLCTLTLCNAAAFCIVSDTVFESH